MFSNIYRACQTGLVIGFLSLSGLVSLDTDAKSSSPSPQAQVAKTPTPQNQTVIYVNPDLGKDQPGAGGSATTPLDTITYALQQAELGTTIQLAPGNYSLQSGEVFPLVLKEGITLQGDESHKGQTTVITGGDRYISPTFARQNITVLAEKDSALLGVTITNPNKRGTALWIESTNPTVKHNTFANSNRDGIFVTGTATPMIEANIFTKNSGNGISVARSAQGEIRNNLFQNTGFGLAIGGTSKPLVVDNKIVQNSDGIFISDDARPVLRNNVIENNKRDGIVIAACSQAQPDLGTNVNPGGNIFINPGRYNIHNSGGKSLVAFGNQLDPSRVAGAVDLGIGSKSIFPEEQQTQCF